MKRLFCLIVLATLLFIPANNDLYAQTETDTVYNDTIKTSNSYGLQFFLVDGLSFALKSNRSYPSTWRIWADFSGYLSGIDLDEKQRQEDITYDQTRQTDEKSFAGTVTLNYIYYIPLHYRFQVYLGTGPVFSYRITTYHTQAERFGDFPQSSSTESTVTVLGLGLLAAAGVESRFLDYLSLFIEYDLSYMNFWNDMESTNQSDNYYYVTERSGTSWELNLASVKLGLIIYF